LKKINDIESSIGLPGKQQDLGVKKRGLEGRTGHTQTPAERWKQRRGKRKVATAISYTHLGSG